MKLPEFIELRKSDWDELESLSRRAKRRTERLDPDEVLRLAQLYRAATADLATMRRRFPTDPARDRLERLVVDARARVNQGSEATSSVLSFVAEGYWRLIWERRRSMALAALMLFAPALLGAVWATSSPELANQLPPEFLWLTEAESTDQGYDTAQLVGFSTFVLNNNIRVTFIAFALGLTWGLGTAISLGYNGLVLGAISGLAISNGNWRVLLAAIMAHGVLELSCIVIGGGAGLSLARAMLRPGDLTRRQALAVEARSSVQIALGTALWLVLAGFIEGFGSRTGLGWFPTTVFGVVTGVIFWGLVVWRGVQARA